MNGGETNSWARDVSVLAVLLCALFGFMLGSRPFSVPDEGRYVEIPREMVASNDYLTPRLNRVKYFEKPPLFYWCETAAIRLFGLSEWSVRAWPALFALFGCLVVYGAGRRLFGHQSGLLSAAVLATSLLYYALSRAIILDMAVSVLLSAALLSFLLGAREPAGRLRRSYFWGFYVLTALATLAKGLIGILIPAMVIGAWILVLGEWRMLKTMYLPTGAVLYLLIAAPWHILVCKANPEFFNFYFIHEQFLRFLTKVHGRYQPPWYFVPVLAVGLFPWSPFMVQAIKHSLPASWKGRHEHRDALFLLLWAGLVFLFFSASSSKLAPYILPVFPPLSLLIGRYLSAAWERRYVPGVRTGYNLYLAMALLLAGAFFAVPHLLPAPDGQALGMYRYTVACTLAGGAVIARALTGYRGNRKAFFAVVATSVLFLVQVNAAAPRVETKSVKNLAATLKPMLESGDEVTSYQTYYQDLSVYLERPITVVDWKGELQFGTDAEENTRQWMIDCPTFWKRWQGPSTMYMITRIETYDAMRKDPGSKLFLIDRDSRNILVSNKRLKLARNPKGVRLYN